MTMDDIRPVFEDDKKSGGVVDFGDFNEGSCAKIITRQKGKIVWIICFDSKAKRNSFIDIVRTIKIDMQHYDGLIVLKIKPPKPTLADIFRPGKRHDGPMGQMGDNGNANFNATTQKLTDGYWITIQNWSQCSLKCGGGTSTLQRMCVPPKNGGKDCMGDAIVTKACNTQPCPGLGKNRRINEPDENTTVKNPKMMSLPFSEKPQRYIKCKIKESDLTVNLNVTDVMFRHQSIFKKKDMEEDGTTHVEFPVRAVMNNETVSIYTGDEINSLFVSFNIKMTKFLRAPKPGCFQLYENAKKAVTLCPFGCENGDMSGLESWDYDFNLFKYQCAYKPDPRKARELRRRLDDKIVNNFLI